MEQIRCSIKTKLNLSIGSAVLFFLVLLLVISYGLFKDSALKSTEALSLALLDGTDKQIDAFFGELERITRSVAEFPSVRGVETERMRLEFLATVRARKRMLRAVYLGTAEGQMYEWGYGPGFVDNAPVFPSDYDPRERPWYKAALTAGDYTITRPYLYASVPAIGITAVIPVRTEGGRFVGILGVDVMLSDLQQIVDEMDMHHIGKVVLLNKDQIPIVNQFAEGVFDPSVVPSEGDGSFIHTFGDQLFYVASKQNTSSGWTLLLALPYRNIMERPMATIRLMIMLDVMLMLFLFVALGVIVNGFIIHPLLAIVKVIRTVESGKQDISMAVDTGDEIALLADELNALVVRVNDYSRKMEEEVRRRTKQLTALQQENLRLRVIEEKERIYGYLHDSLGARLTNIFLSNSVAQNSHDPELLKNMHERIEDNTQLAIGDLKEILAGADTDTRRIIDFRRLVTHTLGDRLKLRYITFQCNIEDSEPLNELPYALRFEFENILQELVSNVLKHSGAKSVTLDISVHDGAVRIAFEDDGKGFDPSEASIGFGIRNMMNRVRGMGGRFSLDSKPGGGTRVTIEVEAR
ncbi:sensor histidine kinase [Sediminispirochaeta bajacaliforniensis]|uniref:sensor histidine kinase n=1 Tax=Sediminispirochaeta bajacaliforniensis TaxID=148 RepID=UPI000368E128|nr:cache domain-containing protein [Sediminispirochaeta bajacaliforniensis]